MRPDTAAVQPRADGGRVVFRLPDADITVWLHAIDNRDQARALAQDWLCTLSGRSSDRLDLRRTNTGKPWLDDTDLRFNLSHSRRWLALAWSRTLPALGVDIEDLPRRGDLAALARRYFHPAEQERWQAAGADDASACWLDLWTRKEAVVKAHGLGLRLTLATLDCTPDIARHPDLGAWHLHTQRLSVDLICSVAWPA